MDRLRQLIATIEEQGFATGNFLGLLHLLIGRRISLADGTVVSSGLTWREAAVLLKRVRWEKGSVCELGLDPASLPPRDRERYWYTAIAQARVDSAEAIASANRLASALQAHGYAVGPPPGGSSPEG